MTPLLATFAAFVQESAPESTPPPAGPSGLMQLIPFAFIAVLFFVLLILPERKKQKQRAKMLDGLKKGDRVMTSGGLYGTVVTTTSEIVVLQVADNVRMRFSRAAIQTIVEQEKDLTVEEKAEPSKA